MKLSAYITELRKEEGINKAELARRTGVTRSLICKYESGEAIPSPAFCQALAAAFNLDANYLDLLAGRLPESLQREAVEAQLKAYSA